MNEWVWSTGRIILIGKNQNTQRKTLPSATLFTTNPIWTGPQVNPGICGERSRNNRVIYLWWEKWPKSAFYCTDQSWCVVLHVACVTNTGCVLFERLCNRNCHTAVLSEVGYVCQISHIQYLDDLISDRYKRSRTYRHTATTVPCCRGCYSDDWSSRVSRVLLLTHTTGEAMQLPLSHICYTHCVFAIRLLSEYSGENSVPADLITISVTTGLGVCPVVIPCCHVPEA